jgi:hypothetical protein
MDIAKVRQLRTAEPFKPFTLRLSDGRRFTVVEPYYIGISPRQDLVLVVTEKETAWFHPDKIVEATNVNGEGAR